jgi:hypothetical protein
VIEWIFQTPCINLLELWVNANTFAKAEIPRRRGQRMAKDLGGTLSFLGILCKCKIYLRGHHAFDGVAIA